jgi:hypothetical protein
VPAVWRGVHVLPGELAGCEQVGAVGRYDVGVLGECGNASPRLDEAEERVQAEESSGTGSEGGHDCCGV